MIVLGIDPGLASLGWGLISSAKGRHKHLAHGVLRTEASLPPELRLQKMYNAVVQLIQTYCPTEVGMEDLFFVKNITSGLPVAEVQGVLLLAFAQAGLTVKQYNPTQIKLALVGIGRAEKHQVQEMVRLLLSLPEHPRPNHAADALAAAICHVHQGR